MPICTPIHIPIYTPIYTQICIPISSTTKGGAAEGRPRLAIYMIGIHICIYVGVYIGTYMYFPKIEIGILSVAFTVICVIGLTTEPERLLEIRKNRMSLIKETESTDYTDLEKIKLEVENAKKTIKKYNWPSIDITRKSVEETAASVLKIFDIFNQK